MSRITGQFLYSLPWLRSCQSLKCRSLLFADDLQIYRSISLAAQHCELQEALDAVISWCEDSSMELNTSKYLVGSFGRSQNVFTVTITFHGIRLTRANGTKDLGVFFYIYLRSRRAYTEYVAKKTLLWASSLVLQEEELFQAQR